MIKEFSWKGHIEKAELVTSTTNLQIGDICWDENCLVCNMPERFMLLANVNTSYFDSSKTKLVYEKNSFEIIPVHKCGNNIIDSRIIIRKALYRVINPIKDINKEIEEEFLDRKLFV